MVGVSMDSIPVPTILGVMREVTMQGSIAYTPIEFDKCIDLISGKKINVTKYIDDFIKLDEAQEAFERLTSGKDAAVKIIFKP